MKLNGTQITGLVIAALAVIGVVLLATLANGEHVDKLLIFLGGLVLPSPLAFGGGSGGGGGSARRTGTIAGAALVAVVLGVVLAGCGDNAQRIARASLAAGADAVVAVDVVTAEDYTGRHRVALAAAREAATREAAEAAYSDAMAPHNALETALRTASHALRAGEALVDTWDAGGKERWLSAAACIAVAFDDVLAAIGAAGVPVPEPLLAAVSMVEPFASGVCHGGL